MYLTNFWNRAIQTIQLNKILTFPLGVCYAVAMQLLRCSYLFSSCDEFARMFGWLLALCKPYDLRYHSCLQHLQCKS